jgi:hypothetical protein
MHKRWTMRALEVKTYATNLDNKSSPWKPVHGNKWRIGEINLMPTLTSFVQWKPNTQD